MKLISAGRAVAVLFAVSSVAQAVETREQKEIMMQMCSRVVNDYLQYLAGQRVPKNVIVLEREYKRCAEVIEEYGNLYR